MRRVMPAVEFQAWFDRFLPGTLVGMSPFPVPATVSDRTDPQIAHLDGLNLSRAWCLRGVASALPEGHPGAGVLLASAEEHAVEGLANVANGHYEGEHWLASFAVYLLTENP
jgi:hypothetical protein